MPNLIIESDASDTSATMRGDIADWPTCRDATSAFSVDDTPVNNSLGIGGVTGTWYMLSRAICWFDTSSIPLGSTITSVTLYAYTWVGVVGSAPMIMNPGDVSKPAIASDFNIANWTGEYTAGSTYWAQNDYGWKSVEFTDTSIINTGGTTCLSMLDTYFDYNNVPLPGYRSIAFYCGNSSSNKLYLDIDYEPPELYTLKDAGLKLMAHRLVENKEVYDMPNYAPIGSVRLYKTDSTEYIEQPVCRNINDETGLMFDDVGGNDADPVYTDITQYYVDLNLTTFVPQFNKYIDSSDWSTGYFGSSVELTNFELYNQGGLLIANGSFSEGQTISKGTRYRFGWTLRLYNDMVSQIPNRKSRSVVTLDGLRITMRRLVQNNSTQDIGSIPSFIGAGAKNSYYIQNASDAQGYFDATGPSYTASTSNYFPLAPAVDDAWWYAREGSDPDRINGWHFDVDTVGVQADTTAIKVQYYKDNDWYDVRSYDDQTNGFAQDGYIVFEPPVDIDVVTASTFYGGSPQGHYYRILIVGATFSITPIPNAATTPVVLRTLQDETDLIMPVNRRPSEIMVSPFSGSVVKFSTELTVGQVPEIYDLDTGILLRKAYLPTSEIGLFTADGIVEDEEIALTTITATANADGEISFATATNPEPLKVISIRRTSDGRIYEGNRFLYTRVVGANYVMQIGGPVSVEYEVSYLSKEIIPSKSFDNILSVFGDSQRMDGPYEIYSGSIKENPMNTEKNELHRRLTPSKIKTRSRKNYDSEVAAADPNFTGPGTLTPTARASGIRSSLRKENYSMGDFYHDVQKFKRHQNFSFKFGYPYIMLTFNVAEYERVDDMTLYLSMVGGWHGKMGYGVAIWGRGEPGSGNESDRYDSWRFIQDSGATPIRTGSDKHNPAIASVKISPRYYTDHDGNTKSSFINEDGEIHILVVGKAYGKGNSNRIKIREDGGNRADNFFKFGWPFSTSRHKRNKAKSQAGKYGTTLTLNYAGVSINPVQEVGDKGYGFRRGVDWKYVFGEDHADWHRESDSEEEWSVTTIDGITYEPLLPSPKLGIKKEQFIFATNPSTGADEYLLYLEKRPFHSVTGAYVVKDGQDKTETSNNGKIDVKWVGWDDSVEWNESDPVHSDDHDGGSGDGAGYVALDFNNEDWDASNIRHINVEYMYMSDPRLSMDYLIKEGMMFARAHFSELSFSPPLQPYHGDRMRLYYEIEFKRRREA
jgi:hypothetical protein